MGAENLSSITRQILISTVNKYKTPDSRLPIYQEIVHARDVLRWVKVLSPNPSFELQSAALLHDSERLTDREQSYGFKGDRNSQEYLNHKKEHSLRSAKLAEEELRKKNVTENSIQRIVFLILHHDDQGNQIQALNDTELNILVASDTLSFFTSIAPNMLEREGKERVVKKAIFMIEKMPASLRTLLAQLHIENPILEEIKNAVIKEF